MSDSERGATGDRFIYPLLLALALLTRLPVPVREKPRPLDFGRSIAWYPVVGAGVGAVMAGVALLWQNLPLAPAVGVILAIGVGLLLTGALHEDGLADTADGFGGGRTREQALIIMKDSRIGAYGAAALILALLLRATLMMTTAAAAWLEAFIIAHATARFAAGVLLWLLPSARNSGQASAAKTGLSGGPVATAFVITMVIAGAIGGRAGLLAVAAAAGTAAVMSLVFWLRLRGVTGDCLGAAAIASELAALAVYAATAQASSTPWLP